MFTAIVFDTSPYAPQTKATTEYDPETVGVKFCEVTLGITPPSNAHV